MHHMLWWNKHLQDSFNWDICITALTEPHCLQPDDPADPTKVCTQYLEVLGNAYGNVLPRE